MKTQLNITLSIAVTALASATLTYIAMKQHFEYRKATTNLSESMIMLKLMSGGNTGRAVEFQEMELVGSIDAFSQLQGSFQIARRAPERARLLKEAIQYIKQTDLVIDLTEFGYADKDALEEAVQRIR